MRSLVYPEVLWLLATIALTRYSASRAIARQPLKRSFFNLKFRFFLYMWKLFPRTGRVVQKYGFVFQWFWMFLYFYNQGYYPSTFLKRLRWHVPMGWWRITCAVLNIKLNFACQAGLQNSTSKLLRQSVFPISPHAALSASPRMLKKSQKTSPQLDIPRGFDTCRKQSQNKRTGSKNKEMCLKISMWV